MENQNTFESMLKEFLTPIIENAVENVLNRNQSKFQQTVKIHSLPDLMNIKMVAEYIHLAVPTVYGLVQKQTIPFYKRGKRLYFKKEDIDKWIGVGRKSTIGELQDSAAKYFVRTRNK